MQRQCTEEEIKRKRGREEGGQGDQRATDGTVTETEAIFIFIHVRN